MGLIQSEKKYLYYYYTFLIDLSPHLDHTVSEAECLFSQYSSRLDWINYINSGFTVMWHLKTSEISFSLMHNSLNE